MRKSFLFSLCCLLLFNCHLIAQSPKYRVLSIPVERNTITLYQPWVGGMNSPQFSFFDLNQDGIKDLFVFDRVGDKVITYLNKGDGSDTAFVYAPQYESLFPKDLSSWALLRDYNSDGIPDIFTHANSGTRVFKGSLVGGQLHWDLVCPLLYYNDGTYNINIWTNVADIPVVTDVNRDGDMDILAYGIFGSTIEYYENQHKEHPGDIHYDLDSFKYVNVSQCWGGVSQNSLSNSINLGVACKGGGEADEPADERHSGNSIYNFDLDRDHDVDLLNGNIGYDNLILLKNCGDSANANICQWDSIYPICDVPIIMPSYPAAFGADVNNDSYEDLLIAPNVLDVGRDVHNVMLYRNTNDASCQFEYQSDSFLVHNMMDFGTDSKAVFYDFNGDGLQDIIVGNYGYFRQFQNDKSTLAYYQNIGTPTSPRFMQRDEDYSNISAFNLIGVNPAFGDLDGDGKKDMLIGDSNGLLQYFKNAGTTGSSYPALTIPNFESIDVGQYSAPFIFDVNGDSLNDLVIGRKDGKLSYYWNIGTRTNPQFNRDSVNANFGGVSVTLPGYTDGYSQPFINRDAQGHMQLYVGSLQGTIFHYTIDTGKLLVGAFARLDSNFLKVDVGTKSTISVADINGDGKMEYVVGNSRGGLLMFSDSIWDPAALPLGIDEAAYNKDNLLIYPNPAKDRFVCVLQNEEFTDPKVDVYNVLGERMIAQMSMAAGKMEINATSLSNGLYIVRISEAGKTVMGKILIER